LAQNAPKVAEYHGGKTTLLGMFMGQVMKKSKGKADPKVASALIEQELEKMK
jgi:aspartyl-tRNA(Asn)/glutamyl-tRNA(Gln) amidotransferase subunit B